jgi:hypothetical protein
VYEFAYLRAALEAEPRGFSPFLAFPNLTEVYRSSALPPFFENRLMSRGRPEYGAQLVELGLDATASAQEIMARTNGRRATDAYEVFAEFEPGSVSDEWETRFFVRAIRYLESPEVIERLQAGQTLFCLRDVQNPVDPLALALRTDKSAIVGYCPAYLCADLNAALADPSAVQVVVDRVNPPPAPLQHRVQCHLRVREPAGFHAYRTGRFEPISPEAVRLAPWTREPKVA